MKKVFVYSILAALAITGCQTEQEVLLPEDIDESEVVIQDAKVFTAIIEDDFSGATKTSLDGSGNVLWKLGDQVSVFPASTVNEQHQVTDASDGKTSAELNKISGSGSGSALDNNVAFYPYASTASIAKSAGNYIISDIELPATQNYAAGSFGNGAFPMAAVTTSTEDTNLKFKNVLGGLKLQLKGTATIASITVTGNNNEILYGDAEVTVANGSAPSISLSDASSKTVTLDCGAGVALDSETATAFIIALPPMTMTGGFTVVVTDTESKQMEITTSKSQTITRSNLLKMPAVNYVGTAQAAPLKFTSTGATSITLTKTGTPDPVSLEYKVDDGEWTSYTVGNAIDLTDGQELSFRAGASGNASFSQSVFNYYTFSITGGGTVAASGNIMSLLNRAGGLTIPNSYCFFSLFYNCQKLTAAPELPATTLTESCYYNMFFTCTGISSAPALPATTLARDCYTSMFQNCVGMTSAPTLPATTLAPGCYRGMFANCYGLSSTPVLPATSLEYGCYNSMFVGCKSITTASTLPATTMAEGCYQNMFFGCSGLLSAPALPATTLASSCYSAMFSGCTNLTSAPALPATTLAASCYSSMFSGCTGLITAPALPATTMTDSCYSGMFTGCTGLTTAPDLPATTLYFSCYSYMFSGCTDLSTAPDLPATSLASSCYKEMFSGCTSLTTAPDLPAKTLEYDCYAQMFQGCSNLNYVEALFTTTPSDSYTMSWMDGVSATGTFVKNRYASWNVTGTNGIPSGWTVIVASIPEYVDLGLPSGLKWATCNLGESGFVSAPEEYGDYFAWGEIEPYYLSGHAQDDPCNDWKDGKSAGYEWASYTLCYGYWGTLTKYCPSEQSGYSWGGAYADNKTSFSDYSYADDAARQILGNSWRTPTDAEWTELADNCTWEWTNDYNGTGVAGLILTSLIAGYTDKSIFLPAAGYRMDTTNYLYANEYGYYWSSSIAADNALNACGECFNIGGMYSYPIDLRCYGKTIRPVTE